MKLKTGLLAGLAALGLASTASAQTEFVITGATAFRSAANNSIIALLGGPGVCEYAFTGTQGINGSNRAIFKGNVSGIGAVIVKASWSGSTQGILDLADQNPVQVLTNANPTSTAGVNLGEGGQPAPIFETKIPRWSFSDVEKLQSQRPNATFLGGPVGVVPFMFIAGESAPNTMTNMTDQLHEALWSTGSVPLSMFTGDVADANRLVVSTGRNNGSGTRALILAETRYGAFTNVFQWEHDGAFAGTRVDGSPIVAIKRSDTGGQAPGNFGYSSNSGVRDMLTRPSNGITIRGFDGGSDSTADVIICSYLTISDALSATGYNPVTGAVSGGEGAKPMTYNGVRYSEENVRNGSYTLWGYQQFYLAPDATQSEIDFDTALRNSIPNTMGNAGIPIPSMRVTRATIDGGLVSPNN